jgi:hypothetical protein
LLVIDEPCVRNEGLGKVQGGRRRFNERKVVFWPALE